MCPPNLYIEELISSISGCGLSWQQCFYREDSAKIRSLFSSVQSLSRVQVFATHGLQRGRTFSFSVSPSSEYSGLISFRMDWLDLLAVQGKPQESSPIPQFKRINSSVLSFLYSPTLISIHDYWKNHSFD